MEKFLRFSKVALLASLALSLATAAGAATIVVNTTTDQALGDCSSSCSLRDAVDTAASGDTIQIPAGHYILTLGQISFSKDLTFAGSGARTTVIDGNASSGIFFATQGINVELDDLSLVNGNGFAGSALAALSFDPSTPFALTIRRCTFANHQSRAQGGAVWLQFVDLTLEDSTFSNNHSGFSGGAIFSNQSGGSIVNSTFSGNTAGGGGALLFQSGGTNPLSLINNTFTANQGSTFSGAVRISADDLTLSNNIIAGNAGRGCSLFGASIVTDHNLDSDGSCGFTGPGDLSGVAAVLGPLANHGGPTDTHALLVGSPAIDAGGNATCTAADQRGVTRPQGPSCDIGAYEATLDCSNPTASPSLLWPPNHKFVPIQISGIANPYPGAVTVTVASIFQDEPTSGAPDATGVGTGNPSVRAERDGGGDGRVYHINFTATAASGSCTGSVTVGVPHDQGHNGGPVDQGPLYDSTLP